MSSAPKGPWPYDLWLGGVANSTPGGQNERGTGERTRCRRHPGWMARLPHRSLESCLSRRALHLPNAARSASIASPYLVTKRLKLPLGDTLADICLLYTSPS